ncbi:putative RNA-binding Zn ribbon-like protein [Homoserinimonas aerilata]|uniref:Putative RNA-binding Zn ribbon-like protein n=1 Tax=Homoserinimonas aerilata TaxID=1162970 RepID=A0A542YAC3_9MICO|nr:CGNR zinc finger domain-containing protein [Homoserinimonas aerilata]TQL45058.1 putative RNA-binding Zn ribbon-like protein [Homoserinimonas aerilata]
MTTGQWLANPDGTRWFFDSGALSLDFGLGGVDVREQFASPADLVEWLAERFERVEKKASTGELRDAVLLREAIASAARAVALGGAPTRDDVDTINLFAAMPDVPPALAGGRRRAGAGRVRAAQALASVARDAVRVFTTHGRLDDAGEASARRRIRECEADDCGYVFLDESRADNRRWCSMQRCGNRAKVRAHRARALG